VSIGVAPAAIMAVAISHPISDVVESLAALVDRPGDRRVGSGRRGELDVAVGHLDQRLFDAVALDQLAMVHLGAERLAVVVDRRVEVANGDGNVGDLREQHGR